MTRLEIPHLFQKKAMGLTFMLGFAAMAFAQEKQSVSGKVVDEQNQPVPYASVEFKHSTNKALNDAALTDEKGNFNVSIAKGTYQITIDAINFKKANISKTVDGTSNLGNLKIQAEAAALSKTNEIQGVTITAAAKQPYKVELDKKTYDASADLTAKGGTLQDVISNVPSVSVDSDGSVSMRGNSNVKFLINGKPSSILGISDDANALRNIPADQIERIEVITNPSSKYEAGGTAGILNIILKKSKGLGFNGSVEGTIGHQPMSRLNTNLSWNLGKWTWFVNGGGGYGRFKTKSFTYQDDYEKIENGETIPREIRDITSFNDMEMKNYNANTGFNYNFTDQTSVNASVNVNSSFFDYNLNAETLFTRLNASKLLNRVSNGKGENKNIQFDAGLEHKFAKKGHLINISGSFQDSKNNSADAIWDNNSGYQTFVTDNLNSQKTWIAKADYELPLGKNSKFEAGARYDDRNSQTDNVYAETTNNTYKLLSSGTSDIQYLEKISAFYTQFKSKIDKFGYQLGVRNENTAITINSILLDGNSTSHKNYSGFFPTAFFSYDLTPNSQLSLNYSKRINRPRSFQLIPTQRVQNGFTRFQGNADLNPSYVNSFELGYNYTKGSKLTLNPTLYYQRTNDDINMTIQEKEEFDPVKNQTYKYKLTMPANIGTEDRYGLDFNYNFNANKWLRLFGNINLFGYRNQSEFNNVKKDNSGFSTQARLTASIKLDKTTNIQLQGNYNGPTNTFQNKRLEMYVANFGLSKNIWSNQGTINFNVQDIFNSRRRRVETSNDSFYQSMNMQMMPRTFMLSLSYRFKNKDAEERKIQQRRRDTNNRDGGGDDMGF